MPSPTQAAIDRLLALGGELVAPAPGEPRRKFELAHMRILLVALGNPQLRFPSVLIAGTNGKGSTAATLASILQAAGHRVGLYTSPHLERPNERIRINGGAITDEELAAQFDQVERAAAELVSNSSLPYQPSFFEVVTAIAFLQFAAGTAPVDVAVLEVGLGGRLDATNVVDPLLAILTDISMDHESWLGSTLAAITREKAGILRPHGLLVTLPQHPEANQTIGEIAVPLSIEAVNAAEYLPMRGGSDVPASSLADTLRNRYTLSLPVPFDGSASLLVDSPLAGVHQQRNIALAVAAAITLNQKRGFRLTRRSIEAGIRETRWPGRLQLLMPGSGARLAPVLLDAAHNPAGAWALRAALSPLPVRGPRMLVFGCMADKAVAEIAQILFPVFDEVLLTSALTSRAASMRDLVEAAEATGAAYRSFNNADAAIEAALLSMPAHGLIVCAGSIMLLGQVTTHLGNRYFA